MRHRVYGKHLGRDKNQRSALFKGLIRSLLLHESITTTESKAKAIKGLVDTVIVKGKEGSGQAKQRVQAILPDKEISKKLLTEIVPRYSGRASGFTGLVRLGRRSGDGAMMVKMSLVGGEEKPKGARVASVPANAPTKRVSQKPKPAVKVGKGKQEGKK